MQVSLKLAALVVKTVKDQPVEQTAADFREAEAKLAKATGGLTEESTISPEQLGEMTTTTQAAVDTYNANNASTGKTVVDTLPASEKKSVTGILKSSFGNALKNIVGDDIGSTIAEALIMYAGARLTGMSGNRALAFAGQTVLKKGQAYQANKRANEETANKVAYAQVDWSKVTGDQLAQFKKDGSYNGLPKLVPPEQQARIDAVNANLAKDVDWSKLTNEQRDNYTKTGSLEGLPLLDPAATASASIPGTDLGKHAQTLYVGGGVGEVEVYSNLKGQGAYVQVPDGAGGYVGMPLAQYRAGLEAQGLAVEKFNAKTHSVEDVTAQFVGNVDKAIVAVEKGNANFGEDSKNVAINSATLGQEAQRIYFEKLSSRKWKNTGELKANVNYAIDDYVKAKNLFVNGLSPVDPVSLDAFIDKRLFKVDTSLPYNKIANTSAQNFANVQDLFEANVAAPLGSPEWQDEYKNDWQDFDKLWTRVGKNNLQGTWVEAASASESGLDPEMAFAMALLDPSHPNHKQALATQRELVDK